VVAAHDKVRVVEGGRIVGVVDRVSVLTAMSERHEEARGGR
jgi:hypothetical protein